MNMIFDFDHPLCLKIPVKSLIFSLTCGSHWINGVQRTYDKKPEKRFAGSHSDEIQQNVGILCL